MECESCTINIGAGCIERKGYRYGGFIICGHCKQQLEKRCHIRLAGGSDRNFRLLYSDGSIKEARLRLEQAEIFEILSAQS